MIGGFPAIFDTEAGSFLAALPHVAAVDLAEETPHVYRVTVTLDEWNWDTWDQAHHIVDRFARNHIREASIDLITVHDGREL